jgi:endogenous inhibitor of DNA gyrase (YacG/DUF329 family)
VRLCLVCGDGFTVQTGTKGAPRKYCSDKCSKIAQLHKIKEHKQRVKHGERCPTCGRTVGKDRSTRLPVVE